MRVPSEPTLETLFVDQTQQTKLLDEITWRKVLASHVAGDFEAHSRRTWRRYPVVGEVKADYKVDGVPRTRTWTLIQIAAGGLTVRAGDAIIQGTSLDLRIQIEDDSLFAKGITCHCTQTLGGYKLGIKFLFSDA